MQAQMLDSLETHRGFDRLIILLAGLLMMLGTVMVYSATATVDQRAFDFEDILGGRIRQAVFAVLGFLVMVFAAQIDCRIWRWERPGDGWWAGSLYVAAVLLLAALFLPGIGDERMGATRAMRIPGGLSFQPSEYAKVALVIWTAAVLCQPRRDLRDFFGGYCYVLGTGGLLVALVGIEDFGTAALMGVVLVAMLFVSGAVWWHLLLTFIAGAAAGGGLIWLKPYRFQRLLTWYSEQPDPEGAGYQILQSQMAIASGGWWGRGLGAGVRKYGYLPQDNNDFIFAIVCEEIGVVGGLAVVLVFLLLLLRGGWIAIRSSSPFCRLIAVGVTMTICLQAAFNLAVVTNLVPTKGISLPFVSAGGSGVLFLGLAAGMLASTARTVPVPAAAVPETGAG